MSNLTILTFSVSPIPHCLPQSLDSPARAPPIKCFNPHHVDIQQYD